MAFITKLNVLTGLVQMFDLSSILFLKNVSISACRGWVLNVLFYGYIFRIRSVSDTLSYTYMCNFSLLTLLLPAMCN